MDGSFRQFMESMPMACLVFDKEHGLVDCNHEAIKLFGMKSKEACKAHIGDLTPEFQLCGRKSEALIKEYSGVAYERGHVCFNWIYYMLDGEVVPCEITLAKLDVEEGYVFVEYIKDMREYMAALNEKQRAEIAEDSHIFTCRCIANMGQDVNTLLDSVSELASIATGDSVPNHKKDECMLQIQDIVKWLSRVSNDHINAVMDIEQQLSFDKVSFALKDVIDRCRWAIKPLAISKGLDLQINVEPIWDIMLVGDPLRLYQALSHLLANGVNFTKKGYVALNVTISHSDGSTAVVYFEVKDTGAGMDQDKIHMLFDTQVQVDGDAPHTYYGIMHGLSISKNLVEHMGGELAVNSVAGEGSAFGFSVKFEKAPKSTNPQ